MTAKRVIIERIILEAKRLLAHSSDPVAGISSHLGFDEPTNFVKFFKRETDLTPTQFRSGPLTATR
jgi:AraC-like DNA-binding protein